MDFWTVTGAILLVELVKWLANIYIPESVKTTFQRKHFRFTTFHSKQVEVLAEAYKLMSACLRLTKYLNEKIKYPFQDVDQAYSYKQVEGQVKEFERENDYRNYYRSCTREEAKTLVKASNEFKFFTEDNEVYLNDNIAEIGTRIYGELSEIIKKDQEYVEDDSDNTHSEILQNSFDKSIKTIEQAKTDFKSRAKFILQDQIA